MNATQQKINQYKKFHAAHKIDPMPRGTMSGHSMCSCGASWKTYYSRHGLEWIALNDECKKHNEAGLQLPVCPDCGGTLAIDDMEHIFCANPTCGYGY